MADSLRDYFVRFIFKTDKEGAAEATSTLDRLKNGVTKLTAGAFAINQMRDAISSIAAPFKEVAHLVHATAEEADALGDLSERLGIATEDLEKWGFAAKMSGVSQEALTTGFRILSKQMGEASQGSKSQLQTFARLGLSFRKANGEVRDVNEMLPEIAKAMQKIPSHAQRSAYAMELFGRGGQEMLPLLMKGPDAIKALTVEMEELGGVTSQAFLDSADEYDKNVHRLTAAWKGVREAVSGPVVDAVNDIAKGFMAWWKINGELVRSKITEWVGGLVTSLRALWFTVNKFSTELLVLAAALNAPLLIMIGMRLMIGLLIDDFANWQAGNDSMIGRMIKNWDAWIAEIEKTHPVLATLLTIFASTIDTIREGWKLLFEGDFKVGLEDFAAFWKLTWFSLATPVLAAWNGIRDAIYGALMAAKQAAKAVGLDTIAGGIGSAAGAFMRGSEAKRITDNMSNPSIVGPSSSPSSLAAGAGSRSKSINAQTSITINAAPGMDERKLMSHARDMFQEMWDSEIEGGYQQNVPEAW